MTTATKTPTPAQIAATFRRLSAGVADDITWARSVRLRGLVGECVRYSRDAQYDAGHPTASAAATVVFQSADAPATLLLFRRSDLGNGRVRHSLTVLTPATCDERTVEISGALFAMIGELAGWTEVAQ